MIKTTFDRKPHKFIQSRNPFHTDVTPFEFLLFPNCILSAFCIATQSLFVRAEKRYIFTRPIQNIYPNVDNQYRYIFITSMVEIRRSVKLTFQYQVINVTYIVYKSGKVCLNPCIHFLHKTTKPLKLNRKPLCSDTFNQFFQSLSINRASEILKSTQQFCNLNFPSIVQHAIKFIKINIFKNIVIKLLLYYHYPRIYR